MRDEFTPDVVADLTDRLRDRLGDALQVVGVAWDADDVELLYIRDDVRDRFGEDVLRDIGDDILADRHFETGNLRRHGLEGPTISGRLYHQALLVVYWVEPLPVGVMADPDVEHFPTVAEILQDALAPAM